MFVFICVLKNLQKNLIVKLKPPTLEMFKKGLYSILLIAKLRKIDKNINH